MFWVAVGIFFIAYAVIVSEKIHKTKVALFGAALTLLTKVLTQHDAAIKLIMRDGFIHKNAC